MVLAECCRHDIGANLASLALRTNDIEHDDLILALLQPASWQIQGLLRTDLPETPQGMTIDIYLSLAESLHINKGVAHLIYIKEATIVASLSFSPRINFYNCIRMSLGYDLFYRVLDAQDYVPQHRERIVLIGFNRDFYEGRVEFDFDLPKPAIKPCLADILDVDVPDKYTLTDNLWAYLQAYAAKHKAAGNGFGYGMANPAGHSRTLSARYYKDGSEILIPQDEKNPRRLTPRECARLQGFPEDFEIPVSDTQAYRQFGNSVAVPLMAEVAKALVTELTRLDSKK